MSTYPEDPLRTWRWHVLQSLGAGVFTAVVMGLIGVIGRRIKPGLEEWVSDAPLFSAYLQAGLVASCLYALWGRLSPERRATRVILGCVTGMVAATVFVRAALVDGAPFRDEIGIILGALYGGIMAYEPRPIGAAYEQWQFSRHARRSGNAPPN